MIAQAVLPGRRSCLQSQATAEAGKQDAISCRAWDIISSGFPGWMGLCTIILTGPPYMRPSCPLGISLPVPTSVTGTMGTPAFEATEKAPCAENTPSKTLRDVSKLTQRRWTCGVF